MKRLQVDVVPPSGRAGARSFRNMPLHRYFEEVYAPWRAPKAADWTRERHAWEPLLVGLGRRRLRELDAKVVGGFLDGLSTLGQDRGEAERAAVQALLDRAYALSHIDERPDLAPTTQDLSLDEGPPFEEVEPTAPNLPTAESAATKPIVADSPDAEEPTTAGHLQTFGAEGIENLEVRSRRADGVEVAFHTRDGKQRTAWIPATVLETARVLLSSGGSPSESGASPPRGSRGGGAAERGTTDMLTLLFEGSTVDRSRSGEDADYATQIMVRPLAAKALDDEKTWVARLETGLPDDFGIEDDATDARDPTEEPTQANPAIPAAGAPPLVAEPVAEPVVEPVLRKRPETEATVVMKIDRELLRRLRDAPVRREPAPSGPRRRRRAAAESLDSEVDMVALGCLAGAATLVVVLLMVGFAFGVIT